MRRRATESQPADGDLAGVAAALDRFERRPRDGRPGELVRTEMVG
jgi:hypothetical protein